jgi:ABC-type sugar transport system substrate-binding protein
LCDGRDPITVGYDVFSDTQDYVVAMNESLKAVSDEVGGCVDFVILVDNLDPATAVANVKTFIQRDVDAVLLFQVVASAQPGIMDLLNAAGIPVISHAVPAPGSTYISQSDDEVAKVSADALIAGTKERFPGQTPWIVLGNEPQGGDVAEHRVNAQEAIIRAAFPDITDDMVIMLDTNGKPDDAFTRMSSVLAKLPDDAPILITGNNDDVVGAMFRALDQGGKSANVLASGIGALYPSGIQNICSYDQFVGTVDFAPDTLGNYITPALLAKTNGAELPDVITVPVSLLTKEGVPARFPDFDC